MRKTWQKPKLIVLVRGRPEERVLGDCKSAEDSGGPSSDEGDCIENGLNCDDCATVGAST